MAKILIKKKYIFLGDCDSINIEIICKSYSLLKNKIKYIIIGNIEDIQKYLNELDEFIEREIKPLENTLVLVKPNIADVSRPFEFTLGFLTNAKYDL